MEDDAAVVLQPVARSIDQERCTAPRKIKFGPTCLPRGACKMSVFVDSKTTRIRAAACAKVLLRLPYPETLIDGNCGTADQLAIANSAA